MSDYDEQEAEQFAKSAIDAAREAVDAQNNIAKAIFQGLQCIAVGVAISSNQGTGPYNSKLVNWIIEQELDVGDSDEQA